MKKKTVKEVAEKLILEGKTNQQVLMVIVKQFNLDPTKAKYRPAWYRSKLVREGKMSYIDSRKFVKK